MQKDLLPIKIEQQTQKSFQASKNRLSILQLLVLINLYTGTQFLCLKRLGMRGKPQQGDFPAIRLLQQVFSSLIDTQRLIGTLRIPGSNRLEVAYINRQEIACSYAFLSSVCGYFSGFKKVAIVSSRVLIDRPAFSLVECQEEVLNQDIVFNITYSVLGAKSALQMRSSI